MGQFAKAHYTINRGSAAQESVYIHERGTRGTPALVVSASTGASLETGHSTVLRRERKLGSIKATNLRTYTKRLDNGTWDSGCCWLA